MDNVGNANVPTYGAGGDTISIRLHSVEVEAELSCLLIALLVCVCKENEMISIVLTSSFSSLS